MEVPRADPIRRESAEWDLVEENAALCHGRTHQLHLLLSLPLPRSHELRHVLAADAKAEDAGGETLQQRKPLQQT